jgi:hypothetical protein
VRPSTSSLSSAALAAETPARTLLSLLIAPPAKTSPLALLVPSSI